MSVFDDILAADAATFVDADLMPNVEPITYQPRGGSPIQITAQVFRDVPVDNGGLVSLKTMIFVARGSVPGMTPIGDKVLGFSDQSGKKSNRVVASISDVDAGGYVLTLE